MKNRSKNWLRRVPFLLIGALGPGLAAVPVYAQARFRCESRGHQYAYCPVDVRGGRVFLVADVSRGQECRENFSWGSDARGIWVDRGCKGDFEVRYDRRPSGGGDKTALIAGGVIGAVILGALIAGNQHHDDHPGVPPWAVGTFQGYNARYGAEVTLTIDPAGGVSGYTRMGQIRGNWVPGQNQFNVGGQAFDVGQDDHGLRVVQRSDRNNVVFYTRQR